MAVGAIIAAAVGTAMSIGGAVYGGIKSAEQMKKAEQSAKNLYSSTTGEAERLELSEGDFLNTALGKGYMTELKNNYRDALTRNVENGMKAGQTEEAKVAGRESANKSYAEGLNRLAQVGTAYRGNIVQQATGLRKLAREQQYSADVNMANMRSESAQNIGDNMASVGSQLIDVSSQIDGGSAKTQNQKSTENPMGTTIEGNPKGISFDNSEIEKKKLLDENYGIRNPDNEIFYT